LLGEDFSDPGRHGAIGFEVLRDKDMDDLAQRRDEIGRCIAYDLRTRPSRKSSNHNAFSARLLSEWIENISRAAPY
jgi:hypothetical protein